MKSLEPTILLLSGALLLASCGSDKTASGGTGSDFPIHPAVAIVMTRDNEVVVAAAWRLWSVHGDSLRYDKELSTTEGGFLLPDTGSWVVEAWKNIGAAGSANGLAPQPLDASYERCLNWIGRTSGGSTAKAILGACDELASPTVQSRSTAGQVDPSAVAAFRMPRPGASSSTVLDGAGNPVTARAWRLWKATGASSGPLAIFSFAGYQAGGEAGALETDGLVGTWVAQGWNGVPLDTLYRAPAFETGLETTLLAKCLGTAENVAPRLCAEQLFDENLFGSGPGQLRAPDVQVVFKIPAR